MIINVQDIYSSSIKYSDNVMIVYDNEFKIIYASSNIEAILGYSQEEAVNGAFYELLYKGAAAQTLELMTWAQRGNSVSGMSKITDKNGVRRDIHQQFYPFLDSDGIQQGICLSIRDITEQQEEIRSLFLKSEIVELSDAFAVVLDRDMSCVYANEGVYSMSGYTQKDICLCSGIDHLYSEESMETLRQAHKYVIDNNVTWQGETDFIAKGGKILRVQQKLLPLHDEKGEVVGVGIIIYDVTAIDNAQQETLKMLELLKTILNRIEACVYVSDLETNETLFLNQKVMETFSIDYNPTGHVCWKIMQKGMTKSCDFCPVPELLKNPEASVVWEEISTVTGRHYQNIDSIINWTDGKKAHMQYSIDITESVNLQKDLKEAKEKAEEKGKADVEARTQIMLDSTPLVASFWDGEGNILDCNMEAVRLFGFKDKADFIKNFRKTLPDCQPGGELSDDMLKNGFAMAFQQGHYKDELMRQAVDGAFIPTETTIVRVPWDDEYGLVIYSMDMREIKASETARQEAIEKSLEMEFQAVKANAASEAKSKFLSNMSHEIRTPMNAILGMSELLSCEELNHRQQGYVQNISSSANALLGIINDILDFSKIEAGKLSLNPTHYNIIQLLENLESMFIYTAKTKGILFEMNIIQQIPPCLYGDELRLRQVLINIIGNAVKFTNQGGVFFTVSISGDDLSFSIADTGIGIKQEDIPKIFNEFDQLKVYRNRETAGTGLGLAITKSLVDMMEGTVEVESQYGRGSVFTIKIPLIIGDLDKMMNHQKSWQPINAPDANILVVDDNEINLNVVKGLLHLSEIECDTALSGKEAIEKISAKKYDLVFMDHMMPGMDGEEATKLLRSKGETELPIIALTANAVEGIKETLLNAGMNDYISKPIDKWQFNRVLTQWLPQRIIKSKRDSAFITEKEIASENLIKVKAQIGEIDLIQGLGRIGNLESAYEKTLIMLCRRIPEMQKKLQDFLASEEWKNFSIEIHGIKGVLYNIGAMELGKRAEELEIHSKEKDYAFCRATFPEFSSIFGALKAKLSAVFDQEQINDISLPKGDKNLLKDNLNMVIECLNEFEDAEAILILEELSGFDYDTQINGFLKELTQLIEEFQYDRAIKLIYTMFERGEL